MSRLPQILIALLAVGAAWQLGVRWISRTEPTPERAVELRVAVEPFRLRSEEETLAHAPEATPSPRSAETEHDENNVSADAAALEALALESSQQSLAVAAEWLRRLPAGEARNRALAAVVARLAEEDPGVAVSLAAKLKPDDGQAAILMQGFDRWVDAKPLLAARWLGENEKHPLADVLICKLASHPSVIATHPALALQWAALLEEPEARRHQVDAVLMEWGRQDLRAASDYIRRLDSRDAAEKRRLLDHLTKERQRRG